MRSKKTAGHCRSSAKKQMMDSINSGGAGKSGLTPSLPANNQVKHWGIGLFKLDTQLPGQDQRILVCFLWQKLQNDK